MPPSKRKAMLAQITNPARDRARQRLSEASTTRGQSSGALIHCKRFWRAAERESGKPMGHFEAVNEGEDGEEITSMCFFVHVGGASPADQQKMEASEESGRFNEWTKWGWDVPRAMQDKGWDSPGCGGSWLGALLESQMSGPPVDAKMLTECFGMIETYLDADVARWAGKGIAMEYFISAGPHWDNTKGTT